jgi:transcriptional regulator with XRE-family HTH domain
MRMSLDYANISVKQMATQLGVSRTTLSRWMADKGERPKRAYISQWALSTGVPFTWIDSGKMPESSPDPDGDGGSRQPAELGGTPTGQKVDLLLNRLVRLPNLGLVATHPGLLPCAEFTLSTLTRSSLDRAA